MSIDLDYEVPTTEEMQPGEYSPPEPGTYHLAVAAVNMQPVSKKGEAKNGFEVTFQIQAGTVEEQAGKTFKECFYWPSRNNKDGGAFLAKRIGRLTTVLGIAQPGMKLGEIPYEEMAARHFVAAVHHETFTGDNGNELVSAKIDGLKMWHVASAEAAAIPKDAEVLELMEMGDDPFGNAPTEEPAEEAEPAKSAPASKSATKPAAKQAAPSAARTTKPAAAKPAAAAAAPAADPYADL